jgi:hypothetical protein
MPLLDDDQIYKLRQLIKAHGDPLEAAMTRTRA